MRRQTADIYVFDGSPALRQERDELIAELTAWAEAKLKAGITRGENAIFIGCDADEMARYYIVNACW